MSYEHKPFTVPPRIVPHDNIMIHVWELVAPLPVVLVQPLPGSLPKVYQATDS